MEAVRSSSLGAPTLLLLLFQQVPNWGASSGTSSSESSDPAVMPATMHGGSMLAPTSRWDIRAVGAAVRSLQDAFTSCSHGNACYPSISARSKTGTCREVHLMF